MNEWSQAKSSFASIQDEAEAVVRMFDQEKKHILGLAQSLAQIQDSFDKLHSRFADIEGRVESFENVSGRLTYRLETTFDALEETKNALEETRSHEAGIAKDHRELRDALDTAERRWVQQADELRADVRALAEQNRALVGENRALIEENRALRDALTASQRDSKLIVAEIANIHSKIALLEEQVDMESLFVRPEPAASRVGAAEAERPLAVPHDPQRVLQEVAEEAGEAGPDPALSELDQSIEFHKQQLGRMQMQAETLIARFAAESAEPARTADKPPSPSRSAPERKLSQLQELSSSYQTLVQELEASRVALAQRPAEPHVDQEPPEPAIEETPEPARLRRTQATSTAPAPPAPPTAAVPNEYSKMNSMRSMYEKRTDDLKAELMQERRERKFAECALRVARAERLHLQHELAKVRAMGWRKVAADDAAEPAPAREPEAVKRRFTAA